MYMETVKAKYFQKYIDFDRTFILQAYSDNFLNINYFVVGRPSVYNGL